MAQNPRGAKLELRRLPDSAGFPDRHEFTNRLGPMPPLSRARWSASPHFSSRRLDGGGGLRDKFVGVGAAASRDPMKGGRVFHRPECVRGSTRKPSKLDQQICPACKGSGGATRPCVTDLVVFHCPLQLHANQASDRHAVTFSKP